MQILVIEFAWNVAGYLDAHSSELNEFTAHPLFREFIRADLKYKLSR
jgi:CTP synthase (UTP-ammonia lyase)